MPEVELDLDIRSPIDRVWKVVTDIERYPATMDSVRSARVVEVHGPEERRCAWSVILQGAVLQWEELEHLDRERHLVTFHQLSGDMEVFEGRWELTAGDGGVTNVRFVVQFEIGIPLLADMLNPVAQRSLRENLTDMLHGIEREAAGAGA